METPARVPPAPSRSATRAPTRVPSSYAEFEGDRQFATTLARGLELLRGFTPDQPLLGNKELSQRLRLPAATVSRLTYTLVAMGYLAQDADSGKYRLASAVLSLGYPLLGMFPERQRARAGMLELAQQFQCGVAIAVRDRFEMVCLDIVRGGERLGHPIDVGRSYSMCGTAMGRAYLAGCSSAERLALINQLQLKAPQDWAQHQESLRQNLADYATSGCCVSVGEVYSDLQAVAVPLGRIGRGELAAINCSFQRRAPNERWLRKVVAPRLLMLARQLA